MDQEHFRVVYDILNEGYLSLSWFVIVWFIGSILFSIVFFFQIRENKFRLQGASEQLGIVALPLFLVVGIYGVVNTLSVQSNCLSARQNNDFAVAKGQVQDYTRGPKRESFTVSGVRFSFMDNDATKCGYKPSQGITLADGMIVRISYRNDETYIFEVPE